MKKLLAVALLALAFDASAGDLVVHTVSKHIGTDVKFNEANFGLGIRLPYNEDLSFESGFYRNSHSRISVYGLADYTPLHLGPVRAGLYGAIVTGYPIAPVAPAAGLVSHITFAPVTVTLRYLPDLHPKVTSAVALSIGIAF
jgi:hypothetical protein